MTDITFCDNYECALRGDCLRFRGRENVPTDWLISVTTFEPEGEECEWKISMKK